MTGGASSAVAASSHAACARFRGTDPLITGVTRRKLAAEVGHSKGPNSTIPDLRWMRALVFEGLVKDKRFASEVVSRSVGHLGLRRPNAVVVANAHVDASTTARILRQAHNGAVANGNATLIHQLAVPFLGLEGNDATDTRPDFAVVAPKLPDASGDVDGSWLIVGDAKDYQRVRSKIDDGRLLKGFLQVALGAESAAAWTQLPAGMDVHGFGVLAVPRNSSLSRLSHVVRRLVERGLVERSVDPDDRRATTGRLTDTGWSLIREAAPGHVTHVRERFLDALTSRQVSQLRDITSALLERLDPDGEMSAVYERRPAD